MDTARRELLNIYLKILKLESLMNEATRSKNLSVRPAVFEDAELLWHWANDASVRERSFNQEPIEWDAHLEWFSHRLASPDTEFYLLVDSGVPVGQIRYDRDETENSAEISFSVAREHRGKSFGIEILRMTTECALKDLDCEKITAVVIEGNEASSKAFIRAGFTTEGLTEIRGKRAFRYIWQPENQEG